MRRIPDIEADGFRRYRRTVNDPKGYRERKNRCIVEVQSPVIIISPDESWHQCRRHRGHGPAGEMCAQHAKLWVEGKLKT